MNIQAMKQSLRQSIIADRLAIAPQERMRLSNKIAMQISKLESYKKAVTVLGYMNFGAEFVAEIFVQQALNDGKQVLLPKVNKNTNELDLYRITDLALDIAPGFWNIREPIIERCKQVEDLTTLDMILLPGVAFGLDGARLGYGGGFYDKLLARLRCKPTLVAAAYASQVVEGIPQEDTDRKIEWLITEKEPIHCVA